MRVGGIGRAGAITIACGHDLDAARGAELLEQKHEARRARLWPVVERDHTNLPPRMGSAAMVRNNPSMFVILTAYSAAQTAGLYAAAART
jgi:hypothetical protein